MVRTEHIILRACIEYMLRKYILASGRKYLVSFETSIEVANEFVPFKTVKFLSCNILVKVEVLYNIDNNKMTLYTWVL